MLVVYAFGYEESWGFETYAGAGVMLACMLSELLNE